MKRLLLPALLFLTVACGGDEPRRGPLSVRGWVEDVEASIPPKGETRTLETEIARRSGLFSATSIWVENSQSVSGGFAQNGSFILLDVPSGNVTVGFNAPGAESAQLLMQDLPANADVLLPRLFIPRDGKVRVLDPSRIAVRLASSAVKAPRATGQTAIIAGHRVPVMEVPISALEDRREYPNPGGYAPLATVR
jgi:hypothetical protein